MFHAQISWNKKRVKTKTENKSAANVPKSKGSTNYIIKRENGCKDTQTAKQILYIQKTGKRLQTSNKSVLGVSLIYKVRAPTTLQKTAAKVVFEGCKGAKIVKTDKSTQ